MTAFCFTVVIFIIIVTLNIFYASHRPWSLEIGTRFLTQSLNRSPYLSLTFREEKKQREEMRAGMGRGYFQFSSMRRIQVLLFRTFFLGSSNPPLLQKLASSKLGRMIAFVL